MSIDYDRLRELVRTSESPHASSRERINAIIDLENISLETAAELHRLRRELTDLRNLMYTHADLLRGDSRQVAADYAYRLTRIMQGGTE